MAVNFSNLVYLPGYNLYGRPVTFYPIKSQPSVPSYDGRGIYNTVPIDIIGTDGEVVSDQRTILDILEAEFDILPSQKDRLFIPAYQSLPEVGMFEIQDSDTNAGGETTLTLRVIVEEKP
jgi:hypothetical protein